MSEENIARFGIEFDASGAVDGRDTVVKTFDDIARAALQNASAVSTTWTKAWGIIKTGMLALGASLGAFSFISLIRQSIQLGAQFETLGVVMRSVGNDAGYTTAFLTDLEKQLRKTGISFKESRQTIISMIQSQLNLADATKLARVAQNAAVTANLNSSESLNRLMIAVRSGNSIIARSIGLQVSWEKSYNDMALTLNKRQSALTEQEKAQARVNAIMEAGIPVAKAYEAAMNTANKQLGSSQRYMEDLKVTIGEAFADVYRNAVFSYTGALKGLTQWIAANGPLIQGIISATIAMAVMTAGMLVLKAAVLAARIEVGALTVQLLASPLAPWVVLMGALALMYGKTASNTRKAAEEQQKYNDKLLEAFTLTDPARMEESIKARERLVRAAKLDVDRAEAKYYGDQTLLDQITYGPEKRENKAALDAANARLARQLNLLNLMQRGLFQNQTSPEKVRSDQSFDQMKGTLSQMEFDAGQPTGLQALRQKTDDMRASVALDVTRGFRTEQDLKDFDAQVTRIIEASRKNKQEAFDKDRAEAALALADQQRLIEAYQNQASGIQQLTQELETARAIREKTRDLDRDLGEGTADRIAQEIRAQAESSRKLQEAQTLNASRARLADTELLAAASRQSSKALREQQEELARRDAVLAAGIPLGSAAAAAMMAYQHAVEGANREITRNTNREAMDKRISQLQQELIAAHKGAEALRQLRRERAITDAEDAYLRDNRVTREDPGFQAFARKLNQEQQLVSAIEVYENRALTAEERIKEMRSNTLRQLQQSFSTTIEQMLTNGLKSWANFFDSIRAFFVRMMADLVSEKIMKKLTKLIFPDTKSVGEIQLAAATGMNVAADKMVAASATYASAVAAQGIQVPGVPSTPTTPTTTTSTSGSASTGMLATMRKNPIQVATVAATAYTVGSALGRMTTNRVGGAALGAAGGAATGAAVGSLILPGAGTAIGAVVGALAGAVAGFFGAGKAAREAEERAKALAKAKLAMAATMDILRIRVAGGNTQLREAIEANRRYFEQLRDDIKKTYKGAEERRLLAEATGLEQREAARIRQEHAQAQTRSTEDLRVRELRSRGLEREADAMALNLNQQREYEDAIKAGFTDAMLAQLRYVQALEKVQFATNGAVSALLNVPTGFKVALAAFNATTPTSFPSVMSNFQPGDQSLDQGDTTIVLTLDGKVVATGVVDQLKKRSQTQFGTTLRWSEVQ